MSDLIRRIDVITVLCFCEETKTMLCKDLRKILEKINEIPSAEPERTAKVVHSEKFGDWKNMCGNCFDDGKKMGLFPEQKYCYECGCRLEW